MRQEAQRIAFLLARGGPDDAQDFARRTLAQYRAAIKRGKDGRRSGYGTAYRRSLVESCLDFRQYLRSTSPAAIQSASPVLPEGDQQRR